MRIPHVFLGLILASAAGSFALGEETTIKLPTTSEATQYDITAQPDSAALTFHASATVHVIVNEATSTVVLNCADIVIDKAAWDGSVVPSVSYDADVQTATFGFPRKVAPGAHLLSLEYHGKILQEASGLFALDYDTPSGSKRALFTQFENADARRFVPCWDEPALKAVFNLTVVVPSDAMAVGNMPIASSEDAGAGLKRVRFQQSPKMSSYLLFFAVGDFERIHRDVGGVDVGVIVQRGNADRAQFALDSACNILGYYNDYFGTRYPLPKLDLVGGPGTSQFFSAMENWGAIFYFERAILFDPKISSEADKRNIHETIAHEMAHQWFGDLVTMRWWDNIWLNEGFASWMQEKATNHFHPEWKVWLDTLESKQAAMQVDARSGTHPVIVPIHDVLQAGNSFDTITYSKGQAVIRMLEAYVGEDAFRAGVRKYIKDYAYGNTDTEQLWSEVDSVSDRKLTAIARDFTLRPGVPLITVEAAAKGISLKQERFSYDSSGDSGGAWSIPALIQPGANPDPSALVHATNATGSTSLVDAPPGSVVNAGQTGYFRILYKGDAFSALAARFGTLTPDDQIGILNDCYSVGCSGKEPLSDILQLAERLPPDAYPSVWSCLVTRLDLLDRAYDGLPGQVPFRHFVVKVMMPALQRLGFEPRQGETANEEIAREDLLTLLGHMGESSVVAWAQGKFDGFIKDHDSLTGSERSAVLSIAAFNADTATWEELHSLEIKAPTQLEKNQFIGYLGSVFAPALAQRALNLALTSELDPTLRPTIVSRVSRRHSLMAVNFAIQHWDVLKPLVEANVAVGYLPRLASSSFDIDVLPPLEAFAAVNIPVADRQRLDTAEGTIRFSAVIKSQRLPELDRWLTAN